MLINTFKKQSSTKKKRRKLHQKRKCFPVEGFSFKKDEISQMAETTSKRDKICEELEQWLDKPQTFLSSNQVLRFSLKSLSRPQ